MYHKLVHLPYVLFYLFSFTKLRGGKVNKIEFLGSSIEFIWLYRCYMNNTGVYTVFSEY